MKRLIAILTLLAAPVGCPQTDGGELTAADVSALDVSQTWTFSATPTPAGTPVVTVDVDKTVYLDLAGEPPFDPTKTWGDNQAAFAGWLSKVKVDVSAPDGAVPVTKPHVEIAWAFGNEAVTWDASIEFSGPASGVYVVIVRQCDELLWHRVEVGPPVPPPPPPPPSDKVTMVTYVYEKDQGLVPRGVAVALQQLNSQKILATEFEEDTTVIGTGQPPRQYQVALEAARKEGLPCLVVQAGETVVRVVRAPTSTEQVLEAVK